MNRFLTDLYSAQMFIAPLFIFISIALILIMLAYVIRSEPCRVALKMFVIAIRVLNILVTGTFFMIFLEHCKQYKLDNPSFPTPWPRVIRQVTEVHVWQRGTIAFVAGMVLQICALAFDVKQVEQSLGSRRQVY